jgi:structural maintenance of chromosome 2
MSRLIYSCSLTIALVLLSTSDLILISPLPVLNGSGKSNILDAICFVLGITNLSQVRAGNLSNSSTNRDRRVLTRRPPIVVANNEDEAGSPIGYQQFKFTVTRQVLLGGKSKYLINGRNFIVPLDKSRTSFTVQLNVNNPHFLIMQGRITKVLNMKPNEILMVEEAAGTRMYETKRVAALRTIEKKSKQVDELNAVLSEEDHTTLERLRGEKNYLKWSKNVPTLNESSVCDCSRIWQAQLH